MTAFNEMNREALRQACRDENISYGKMTKEQMISALSEKATEKRLAEQAKKEATRKALAVAIEADKSKDAAPKAKKEPVVKIEKNGIRRPKDGTVCGKIWAAMDDFVESKGAFPDSQDVHLMIEANSWNKNNTIIEFYRWRRFNGKYGRQ